MASAAAIFTSRVLVIACVLVCELVGAAVGSDADPLQDYCVTDSSSNVVLNGFTCKSSASPADFSSSLFNSPGSTANALGVAVTLAGASNFGGLNTQGLSIARIDYAAGGLVPPHVHPRASEVLLVLQGTISAAFVDGSNKLYSQTLQPFDLFVFPRGLIHYSVNLGTGPALSISGFNSQNPGLSLIANALFASNDTIPDFILEKAFHLNPVEVELIKASFRG
ncbi:hypothetical protein O6H91_14G051000 [Diphasiastrum complanatum]|uniref:Uncharacterized protein n=2 Tax=Diphasiastrum complanatum TaxID=34168 RepID=A0ACC2BP91_DIPCM|nr:hypothetical protein O6H91_14G050300 [Diphasiastrum complanatum]KAJ7531612.1 hypothetical protein O6H91_14G051000 [Diphasiastrum complanatum]